MNKKEMQYAQMVGPFFEFGIKSYNPINNESGKPDD